MQRHSFEYASSNEALASGSWALVDLEHLIPPGPLTCTDALNSRAGMAIANGIRAASLHCSAIAAIPRGLVWGSLQGIL